MRSRTMRFSLLPLLLAVFAAGSGEPPAGPRSMGVQEFEILLHGRGGGMAKPAELNGWPGPKHVLELAEKLDLTPAQRAEAAALAGRMEASAKALGLKIINAERELDAVFAGSRVDRDKLRALLGQIAELRAELRYVHLNTHIEMARALTDEQRQKYRMLRGH